MIAVFKFGVSLLPVVAFLAALVFLDSFKLVSLRAIVRAIVVGALAAVASLWLNELILHQLRPDFRFFSRYDAPKSNVFTTCASVGDLFPTISG